jgi:hypothetical protein
VLYIGHYTVSFQNVLSLEHKIWIHLARNEKWWTVLSKMMNSTVFTRVICALFFSSLADEKSGYVKYADLFSIIWYIFVKQVVR